MVEQLPQFQREIGPVEKGKNIRYYFGVPVQATPEAVEVLFTDPQIKRFVADTAGIILTSAQRIAIKLNNLTISNKPNNPFQINLTAEYSPANGHHSWFELLNRRIQDYKRELGSDKLRYDYDSRIGLDPIETHPAL